MQMYSVKVQVPGKDGAAKIFTVGKAELDLAAFAAAAGPPGARAAPPPAASKLVPIVFKVRRAQQGRGAACPGCSTGAQPLASLRGQRSSGRQPHGAPAQAPALPHPRCCGRGSHNPCLAAPRSALRRPGT